MPVHLEHFPTSWGGAVRKAKPVYDLVQANRELLRDAQPKTVKRYRDYPHSVHNLHRLAHEDPNFHGYIIREEDKRGRPIGLASVATRQSVWHPGLESAFHGSDVSYWLEKDRRFTEHVAVAEALIQQSGALTLRAIEHSIGTELSQEQLDALEVDTTPHTAINKVFAVVPTAHTALSPGFAYRNTLPAVGDPAVFSLPPDHVGPDHLEIARGGQVSQLHYGEFPIPAPR